MTTYQAHLKKALEMKKTSFGALAALVISIVLGILAKSFVIGVSWFFLIFASIVAYIQVKKKLEEYSTIKKMESVFPDFLQLMGSNLRAGMTTDRALLMSARKEFHPLDAEIVKLGKELMTGKDVEKALYDMAARTGSKKIMRTISLIISGIRSGGDIAILLEETAANTRDREFVQKKAASNVLMYVIFIFAAIMLGAPGLFALSTVLVEILSKILSGIPEVQTSVSLPFTLSAIDIPTSFIVYFAFIFLLAIGIIGSLVLGLVMRGSEKEGLKFIIPTVLVSSIVFLSIRLLLLKYFVQFFEI